jgi:hypothetical protein
MRKRPAERSGGVLVEKFAICNLTVVRALALNASGTLALQSVADFTNLSTQYT